MDHRVIGYWVVIAMVVVAIIAVLVVIGRD
jgi:hypothetical protein